MVFDTAGTLMHTVEMESGANIKSIFSSPDGVLWLMVLVDNDITFWSVK